MYKLRHGRRKHSRNREHMDSGDTLASKRGQLCWAAKGQFAYKFAKSGGGCVCSPVPTSMVVDIFYFHPYSNVNSPCVLETVISVLYGLRNF